MPDLPANLTEEERKGEFKSFLKPHLFGLVAAIKRPTDREHFPMASVLWSRPRDFASS